MLICYISDKYLKILFDLWLLIHFTIFEEKPYKTEENPSECPLEEESIDFEEDFLELLRYHPFSEFNGSLVYKL